MALKKSMATTRPTATTTTTTTATATATATAIAMGLGPLPLPGAGVGVGSGQKSQVALHWFRKGLRLHDNPALLFAAQQAQTVYPVFCIDPHFAQPDVIGVNRYSFLLESLEDLDRSLRRLGSRLVVLRGSPEDVLVQAIERWRVNLVTFESDFEPYAKVRDETLRGLLAGRGVRVQTFASHTLHALDRYPTPPPNSYQAFLKVFSSLPSPRKDEEAPSSLPSMPLEVLEEESYGVPTLEEMGYHERPTTSYRGGESEALARMQRFVAEQPQWVARFSKPDTSPNSLQPSTTVLSPYLKFGCLSPAKFFHLLRSLTSTAPSHTQPPVSLTGQLLWREFFYLQGYHNPRFDRMEGNAQCRQIPWERDQEKIERWKLAQTGFPFIDAIMTQLRVEGWIHHLARHAVACFLTRGDLYQHWEEGVRVFDLYLLDSDWALNNANWQWLSCSAFFYQYFRVYSPISFGKKTDPNGDYIRHWLPQLSLMPSRYIFEPWTAPRAVQEQAGCIIGRDYPLPMVDHAIASKENMAKMKAAYAANQSSCGEEEGDDEGHSHGGETAGRKSKPATVKSKRQREESTSEKGQLRLDQCFKHPKK